MNEQVTVVDNTTSVPVQPWKPVRIGIALLVGSMLCLGPFMAFNAILLPARIEIMAPDSKIAIVAVIATSGVIVATVANVLFGALSDLTRSRFGRRIPWILFGSTGAGLSLAFVAASQTIPMMIFAWCLFQFFLNAVIAPLLAMLPDRVPVARRGTMSALYGLGQLLGIALLGQITAPRFLTDPTLGMFIFAGLMFLAGPLIAVIAPEPSNRDQPREPFSRKSLIASFAFPIKESRDYYLVFSGRVLNIIGTYVVTGYQLYIVTDYLGASTEEAARILPVLGIISLIGSMFVGTAIGPISDKFKRRKIFIVIASILMAFGTVFLFFVQAPWAIFVFGAANSLGGGIYNSIEQVVSTEVLPSGDQAAKDLGFLNVAATGGQAVAPALTSAVIAITGSFGPAFLIGGALLLGSSALFGMLRKTR
ncbi:MFS transporter [Pseudoclavibacter terrae]|uniref:MFS transporter n=1 Tax=Pseudoclavibacter terrae TaxID=1530195 RepID=A0A7J5B0M8_9MICO|nr:MFS transporter [Pseudoclavibacter terrae]KAB1637268.1 MFS transporter [Pseudoclavibacter terrae]